MSLPSVSRHLKVRERAGLVVNCKSAQWRPCRLDAAPLVEAGACIARLERQLAGNPEDGS